MYTYGSKSSTQPLSKLFLYKPPHINPIFSLNLSSFYLFIHPFKIPIFPLYFLPLSHLFFPTLQNPYTGDRFFLHISPIASPHLLPFTPELPHQLLPFPSLSNLCTIFLLGLLIYPFSSTSSFLILTLPTPSVFLPLFLLILPPLNLLTSPTQFSQKG